ncbi:MAG: type I-C CRISPR-associated protein Cas8c/Csd1 [Bacillota bacterium]|nr:type I-C CRISPR-associated protein Cas8c/Csd1 [Bacillota bacterium]
MAPVGWEYKEIPFIIVLDQEGQFLRIEDTREGDGRKLRAKSYLVPQGVKRSSGIAANLLWDTPVYVLGLDTGGNAKRAKQQKKAFLERLQTELGEIESIHPIIKFLENIPLYLLEKSPNWDSLSGTNVYLTFRFEGDNVSVCRKPEVIKAIEQRIYYSSEEPSSLCLVTGEQTEIKNLHTVIKGVYGAQTSGANIVSFNQDSFRSYGKHQGMNAPIGIKAEFAYTTGLNYLLRKGSKQRLMVGDTSTVFWSGEVSAFETDFAALFEEPPKDDPSAGTERVKALFNTIHTGAYKEDKGDIPFYILGLSPNASRISIRFWHTGTIAKFSKNITNYFEDFHIVKPDYEREFYSLWRILVNLSIQDKSENIPPKLAGDFMRSILTGGPYPATLLTAVLRRIKSDMKRVTPVRAATIKAYLNRFLRFYPQEGAKEVMFELDKNQPSKGYHLGRLFATLEKIQEDANPGLNSTIRDRYYGAACASPVTVFPNLLKLKNHHLAKLDRPGLVVFYEKLLGEIFENFSDFSAHLDLHEQGRFAVGYYHQRQDFFKKKEVQNDSLEMEED